jgi:hypothetical protein
MSISVYTCTYSCPRKIFRHKIISIEGSYVGYINCTEPLDQRSYDEALLKKAKFFPTFGANAPSIKLSKQYIKELMVQRFISTPIAEQLMARLVNGSDAASMFVGYFQYHARWTSPQLDACHRAGSFDG